MRWQSGDRPCVSAQDMVVEPHREFNQMLVTICVLEEDRAFDKGGDTNSTYQYFYKRRCARGGKHVAYRSKAAVARRPGTLECPRCNPQAMFYRRKRGRCKPVGEDEFRLHELLDDKFPDLAWSIQDRIRGWRGGAVDVSIFFPMQRWLAIQVDGPTHRRSLMSGRSDQASIDARFCEAATRAGWSVLRLNTEHSNYEWEIALNTALDACAQPNNPPQVFHG